MNKNINEEIGEIIIKTQEEMIEQLEIELKNCQTNHEISKDVIQQYENSIKKFISELKKLITNKKNEQGDLSCLDSFWGINNFIDELTSKYFPEINKENFKNDQ